MAKAKILIAEDDTLLRDVYVKKFSISGFDILTVKNGEEAIQAIEEHQPDIMILDINMPVIDGFGVLEKFPRSERSFPIILLTNYGDDKNRQKGIDLGADDFFIKREMTMRTLLEMVENLLKSKKFWSKEE